MHWFDIGWIAPLAFASAVGVWATLRWKRYGFVLAVALVLAAALVMPISLDYFREAIEPLAFVPPHQLATAWLIASAVILISLVAVWAGYQRGHWFWRLAAMASVLAALALIEANEPILFALAVTAPVGLGAWLLRRWQDRRAGITPAGRAPWRWTLRDAFLAFIIVGLLSLALRSLSRGSLYLASGPFAITCCQQIVVTLLAATAGLAYGAKTRGIAALLALALAVGGTFVRGPAADDGLGLAFLLILQEPHRFGLSIDVQAAIAVVLMLAYGLFAATRRTKCRAWKYASGTLLGILVAGIVAPLAIVFPGMLPPEATITPLPRSETYAKIQMLGQKVTGFKTPGFNAAPLMKDAATALADSGNVWFDADRFRKNELSLQSDPSFHYEQMLSLAIDFEAAKAEKAGRPSKCLELAILQWRLARVLRRGGLALDWLAGSRAEQYGCATVTAVVNGLSSDECRQALLEVRESQVDRPSPATVAAYNNYWNRAFYGWRNELSRAAHRLLGEDALGLSLFGQEKQLEELDRRSLLRLRLLETRLALELYRRAKNQWPDRLEDLVSEYLPAVPSDPFTASSLIYRRREEGFLLYGPGPDGRDDGGRFNDNAQDQQVEGFDIDWEFDRRIQAAAWPRKP